MTRKILLSAAQRERFFALPLEGHDLIRHYTLSSDDIALINSRRRPQNRLGFAVQLCLMRYPGRALGPGERPPAALVSFIAEQLRLHHDLISEYSRREKTRREHMVELQGILGCRTVTVADYRVLAAALMPSAIQTDSVEVLIPELLDLFRRRRILIPVPATIERIALICLRQAQAKAHRQLAGDLTDTQKARLDDLLTLRPDARISYLAWLRLPPNAPVAGNFIKLIERFEFLRSLGIERERANRIHRNRLLQLSREGAVITQQHLLEFEEHRRYAMLAAIVLELMTKLTDDAIDMFERMIGSMFAKAMHVKAERFHAAGKTVVSHMGMLTRLVRAVVEARHSAADPFAAMDSIAPLDQLLATLEEAENIVATEDFDCLGVMIEHYHTARTIAPRFLNAFEFRAADHALPVINAIESLRKMYGTGARKLPADAPVSFIKGRWRPYVFPPGAGTDRRYYELCVFTELRDNLRSGGIFVVGSLQYKDLEEYQIPQTQYAQIKAAGELPVSVPVNFSEYIATRRERLHERLVQVEEGLREGELTDVRLRNGLVSITPLKRIDPPGVEPLRRLVSQTLPRIKITDLLLEVDSWTGFSQEFVDLRDGSPVKEKELLLTAILANGLNLGLDRMAEACPGMSPSRLYTTEQWHVRKETYARALAQLVDYHHALPFARHWGAGTASSSDGQYYKAGGRGEAQSNINARYGSDPGVKFYTHISDQFAPFHTKVIRATASEAAHILDGLLYHESNLRIAEHYTDTAGATEHVFALCHLLGFRFVPRIRNLSDRRLFALRPPSAYPVLERQIKGRIAVRDIEPHWDDVLRAVTSIRKGTVTASLLLSKLGAYPRQNGLAVALREIGRLERTLFTLDWFEDPALRRRNLTVLNIGESCNSLKRAVFLHRLGEVRDRTLENQNYRANGLNLVVAAIILWNTVYMEHAVKTLRQQGRRIPDELLSHIAPLLWEHINLTGDYIWKPLSGGSDTSLRHLRLVPQYLEAA
jgi:TnpA family transposase